ncbi:MAG: hypothetical protein Q4C73_09660 [Eubacteriales bacterium]|nr:hypothetical protein [Eubacteriales bacterium]
MKYRYKKIGAAGLAALMACASFPVSSFAGPAAVSVDESMYVNLDYYGKPEKINVVKGVSLNGQTAFTDYGTYLDVTNMTDHTQPEIKDGEVAWKLPEEEKGRFYYKCGLDTAQVVLPWDFDVSYKLNGVPTDGDKLAGASGTVEIHVEARANDQAAEYYRNNMILAVAVLADLTKCYSVEAEGAQIQNLGSQTGVVFTALPGEDGDYTVRLGTDSFETNGVFMTMIPGTVEDLEHVTDLKDAKDTWKESGDQFYDSMEQMALSVEAMRDGVGALQSGLGSAESARQTWSGSKDHILDGNDQVLQSLTAVSQQVEAMVPHIETAKEAAKVVHDSMGEIVDTTRELQDPLRKLNTALRGLRSGSDDLSDEIPALTGLMQQLLALDAALQASEQAYVTQLGQLAGSLAQIDEDYYEEDAELVNDLEDTASPSNAASAAGISAGANAGAGVAMNTAELMQALMQKKAALEKLAAASSRLAGRLSNLLEDVADTAKYTAELTDYMDVLVEDTADLYDSVEVYYPDFQNSLDDTEELVNRTTAALNNSISTAALIQNTLRESSGSIDAAARDSIQGTMELLDKSLSVLDSTASVRKAGRSMKDVMDREWEDLDGDTRFLYMDPSAEKVSFTSDKNQEPNSLQIILRTQEISLDDGDALMDAETEEAAQGPLQRMWNVLVRLWEAVTEIFRTR